MDEIDDMNETWIKFVVSSQETDRFCLCEDFCNVRSCKYMRMYCCYSLSSLSHFKGWNIMDVFLFELGISFFLLPRKSQLKGGKIPNFPTFTEPKNSTQIARSTFGRSTTRTGGFQVVTSVGTFRDDSDGRFFVVDVRHGSI